MSIDTDLYDDNPDLFDESVPLWLRQPCDTDKSWDAFQQYMELGPDRTLVKVATNLGYKTDTYVRKWSYQHKWAKRIEAYDREVAREKMGIRKEAIRHNEKVLASELDTLLAVAIQRAKDGSDRLLIDLLDRVGFGENPESDLNVKITDNTRQEIKDVLGTSYNDLTDE